MPTALSLKIVMEELEETDNKVLSKLTGLSEPQIERCKKLLDLPEKFQKLSLDPDPKTRIPSNFWIESAPVLDFAVREILTLQQLGRARSTEKLVAKYRAKKIKSVIHFRRIMDAYTMSEGDDDMRRQVMMRVEEYFLRPDLETRTPFDGFVTDMRRARSALAECEDFVSKITKLKLEYIADDEHRRSLQEALRKVRTLCMTLEEQLRGSDDPDIESE